MGDRQSTITTTGEASVAESLEDRESATIRQHYTHLRRTVGNDIEYFAGDFYQKGFITRDKKMRVTKDCKPDMLLDSVLDHLEIVHDKEDKFRDFIATFSAEGAYCDLASAMEKSYSDRPPVKVAEKRKPEDVAPPPIPSPSAQPTNSSTRNHYYYDIMVLGRTEMGKSTAGNKLLGIDPKTYKPYSDGDVIKQWGCDRDQAANSYFEAGDGINSVTDKCSILSNGNIRVMDTRGFAYSQTVKLLGAIQTNVQTCRLILQAQQRHNLRFVRVLYFYPQRGPPDRVDGTLQEELRVIYGYFGQSIFNIMVIIATNHRKYQIVGFDDEAMAITRRTVIRALCHVIYKGQKEEDVKCPPIVYLPFKEDHREVFKLISSATVISEDPLTFSPEFTEHAL